MVKTVMVVDDDPDIRDSVGQILRKIGYDVINAVSGDDCLEKLQSEKPDLILMDIHMPGTPIRAVVRKITNIKIIYLTIVAMPDAEKMGLLEPKNVVGFISKPFNVNDLIRTVKENI